MKLCFQNVPLRSNDQLQGCMKRHPSINTMRITPLWMRKWHPHADPRVKGKNVKEKSLDAFLLLLPLRKLLLPPLQERALLNKKKRKKSLSLKRERLHQGGQALHQYLLGQEVGLRGKEGTLTSLITRMEIATL